MSNDLISRSALSKKICNKECEIPGFETEAELNAFLLGLNAKQIIVMKCLSDAPAVYDVDKVVERLEVNSMFAHADDEPYIMFDDAVEIVKSGGIE